MQGTKYLQLNSCILEVMSTLSNAELRQNFLGFILGIRCHNTLAGQTFVLMLNIIH